MFNAIIDQYTEDTDDNSDINTESEEDSSILHDNDSGIESEDNTNEGDENEEEDNIDLIEEEKILFEHLVGLRTEEIEKCRKKTY